MESKKIKKCLGEPILNMKPIAETISLINYQCNYCGKRRKLIIPKLLIKAGVEGELIQYNDVHRCKNNEYSAIICFIDQNLVVRSQARVKATHAGYEPDRDLTEKEKEEKDPFTLFNIPLPQQNTFVEKIIKTFMFSFKKIEGLTIKDRLRNTIYKIAKQEGEKEINVISRLGFIEITLYLKKDIAKEIYNQWRERKTKEKIRSFPYDNVRKWIQELANELESIVTLDEQIMPYIAEYLDRYISVEPDNRLISKMILLLHMTISLPVTIDEQTERFFELIQKEYKKMTTEEIRSIQKERVILELCKDNLSKTLQDIYLEQNVVDSFSDFIEVVSYLKENKILTVYKLQFDDF